jgi:hypothetical protein
MVHQGLSAPKKSETAADSAASPKTTAAPDRLPRYYAQVVNPEQRVEIYLIQDSYHDRIADLKAQLEALTSERDKKIAAVLTPSQRKKVEELEAEAKAKAQDRRGDGDDMEPSAAPSKTTSKESAKTVAKDAGDAAPKAKSVAPAPAGKAAATAGKKSSR